MINRGVNTIGTPDFLKSPQNPLKKIKKTVMFSLIPFFDSDFVKCLLPLWENKSFSQEEVFYLYTLTDRVFNRLSLRKVHRVKDADVDALKASQSYLYSLFKESTLPVPAVVHQLDNVLIAQIHKIHTVPTRNWMDNRESNQLTIEH